MTSKKSTAWRLGLGMGSILSLVALAFLARHLAVPFSEPPQTTEQYISEAVGYSINTAVTGAWDVPDSSMDLLRRPAVGRFALLMAYCQDSAASLRVSVLAYQAQPGHTAQEVGGLLSRQSEQRYQPSVPFIIKEVFSVEEVGDRVVRSRARPQPAGTPPRFVEGSAGPSRRSELEPMFPALGMECKTPDTSTLLLKDSLSKVAGIPALASWPLVPPKAATLAAWGLSGVKVEAQGDALTLSWSGATPADDVKVRTVLADMSERFSNSGRPRRVILSHQDGVLMEARHYPLQGGSVSLSVTQPPGQRAVLNAVWRSEPAESE